MRVPKNYSWVQIVLHWLLAILITINWFNGDGMGRVFRQRLDSDASGFDGNTLHVWLGGAIFLLVLLRVAVRLMRGAPKPPADDNALIYQAGIWSHRLLYLLLVLVPGLGALAWYGKIHEAGDLHELAVNALLIVVSLHTAAAMWHHFVQKDNVLKRMLHPTA